MKLQNISTNSWFSRTQYAFAILLVSLLMLAGTAAHACGDPAAHRSMASPQVASVMMAKLGGVAVDAQHGIVGLWHVTYSADGQLFYDALDLWHRDGTEMETANFNPIEGNFCLGLWNRVGSTVQLGHVGWLFDGNGNSAGYFVLDESNTVSEDGQSYQGTFVYRAYDPNGMLLQEVDGTLNAVRLGP